MQFILSIKMIYLTQSGLKIFLHISFTYSFINVRHHSKQIDLENIQLVLPSLYNEKSLFIS